MGWLYNYCPGPAPSPTASIFPSPMDLVMLLALYFSFLDTLLPWNPPPPFCSERSSYQEVRYILLLLSVPSFQYHPPVWDGLWIMFALFHPSTPAFAPAVGSAVCIERLILSSFRYTICCPFVLGTPTPHVCGELFVFCNVR